eukprot:g5035.t1
MSALDVAKVACSEPRLVLLYASVALATPTFDLPSILPLLLADVVRPPMQPATIGAIASLFPLVAVPATVIAASVESSLPAGALPGFYTATQAVSVAGLVRLAAPGLSPGAAGPVLSAIMAGCAPTLYVAPQRFLLAFGGKYTGTFNSLLDLWGNVLLLGVYAAFPVLRERGGWPLVVKVYAAMQAGSLACMWLFQHLEATNRLIKSPFENDEESRDGGD